MKNRAISESLIGISRILIASVGASIVLAPVLALINVLRNYGLPPDLSSVSQTAIYHAKNPLSELIDMYNSSLTGYARFGSGIGMIGGAFWAMGAAKGYCAVARVLNGLVAGLIIGARLVMMITSDVVPIIAGGIIGGAWTAVYLYLAGLPSTLKPLPRLTLKTFDVEPR